MLETLPGTKSCGSGWRAQDQSLFPSLGIAADLKLYLYPSWADRDNDRNFTGGEWTLLSGDMVGVEQRGGWGRAG